MGPSPPGSALPTSQPPRDVAGPFFEPNAPNSYFLAPAEERADARQAVVLQGRVTGRGRSCPGIPGATVEVWYAGGDSRKLNQHYKTQQLCPTLDEGPYSSVLSSQFLLFMATSTCLICPAFCLPAHYTFPPDRQLWYRGKTTTDRQGRSLT